MESSGSLRPPPQVIPDSLAEEGLLTEVVIAPLEEEAVEEGLEHPRDQEGREPKGQHEGGGSGSWARRKYSGAPTQFSAVSVEFTAISSYHRLTSGSRRTVRY